MRDGCTFDGPLVKFPESKIPFWMYRGGENPVVHLVFLRIGDRQFVSMLQTLHVFTDHDPTHHGRPMSVQINIGNTQFYSANFFQVYNVNEHDHQDANENSPGNFPPNNHIYIIVPRGHVYSSSLHYHSQPSIIGKQSH